MPNTYTAEQAVELAMLALVVGRESRNQPYDAMLGVAFCVRNRVDAPRWWGRDWLSVIAHPAQFSSISPPMRDADPNLWVYPPGPTATATVVAAWASVLQAAEAAYWPLSPDPTSGCDSYFDESLNANPPAWAGAATSTYVRDLGSLHFYKTI